MFSFFAADILSVAKSSQNIFVIYTTEPLMLRADTVILLTASNRFLFNQVDCGHFEQSDLAQGISKMSLRTRVCPSTGAEPVPLHVLMFARRMPRCSRPKVPPCLFSASESPSNCMCLLHISGSLYSAKRVFGALPWRHW